MRKLARKIARKEGGNKFVIELAALLHDIADWKFNNGDDSIGPRQAKNWLKKLKVELSIINHIGEIIEEISFKGAGVRMRPSTLEAKIVQDADKLDAIGAIGIARTFAYGGNRGHEIHVPDSRPVMHKSFAQYKASRGTTINHFYEKLLLLKNRMNTKTAKKLAQGRHKFMQQFLKEFFREWNG